MLQICDIHKQYKTGDLVQTALDGVSLTLRDNEFVAILGPSGSGKTTLLNVIGGLDRYDSGDLIINGISTKRYSDRDWDSYRNHTIGFVFQSYNLIPHQTVLANVELALTISGISRSERKRRATKALEDVGLGNQLHKRPNQMSGGQMQRVAIARALVNDPQILLADEPTGALDSETSVQVMELLKEVSKDRLVVMVTHNPELANDYANRIVRVRDGKIIDDSNPYIVETSDQEPPKHKNLGRASMSFFTALSLSFNNLRTKKGRTILTAFAGSIGIIGIALILSLSTGFQMYIDQIQEDTLSNYPLSIQSETADMTSMMTAFGSVMGGGAEAEEGTVVEQQMISQMFAQVGSNDLASFKTYLEENYNQVEKDINDIQYSYGVKPLIYLGEVADKPTQVNPGVLFGQITGMSMMSSYMDSDVFYELMGNHDLVDSQYDVVCGRWPEAKDELIIVLSSPSQITDYIAYTIGLKDQDALMAMVQRVMEGQEAEINEDPQQWSYEALMALRFRLVPASAKYKYNAEYEVWEDMSDNKAYMTELIESGLELKIVGIVCPKEGVSATALSPGVAYTKALTDHVISEAAQTEIVKSQLADMSKDVFTGKPFGSESEEENGLRFEDMITVNEDALSSAFGFNMNQTAILNMLENYMKEAAGSMDVDTGPAQADFTSLLSALCRQMLTGYIGQNADHGSGGAVLKLSDAEAIVDAYLSGSDAQQQMQALEAKYQLPAGTFQPVCRPLMVSMVTSFIASNMSAPPIIPDITPPEETLPSGDPTETPSETQPTQPDPTVPQETPTDPPSEVPSQQPVSALTASGIVALEQDAENTEEEDSGTDDTQEDVDLSMIYATITTDQVDTVVNDFMGSTVVSGAAAAMATRMMQNTIQSALADKLAGFGNVLSRYLGNAFYINEEALASAFQFNMNEEELRRLLEAMSSPQQDRSAQSNLRSLGYADHAEPTSISVYFSDFAAKENFLAFIDGYNELMEQEGKEDQVISYTDITGIMMSSVRTIIDSVSYVLIAFVAVSLIVSSIMIGIITYISVMERTKEIGVLRAIGASKRNISQVFNAETFIIGLCSGLLGVGITLVLNIPINYIIHSLTDNLQINAQLPVTGGIVLIVLSMILTMIGGLIPSKHAAKKDPVIALRSE